MIHATRRFTELIGHERLVRGARMSECGRDRTSPAFLDGKEDFILYQLYGIYPSSRYAPNTDAAHSYGLGWTIERLDLDDIVKGYPR